jgi:hypothetical protein
MYTVKEKEGKLARKPHPIPRNPYRNLKSENSQDYAQRNFTFMNSASGNIVVVVSGVAVVVEDADIRTDIWEQQSCAALLAKGSCGPANSCSCC